MGHGATVVVPPLHITCIWAATCEEVLGRAPQEGSGSTAVLQDPLTNVLQLRGHDENRDWNK